MRISGTIWEKYLDGLRKMNNTAAEQFKKRLEIVGVDNPSELSPAARKALIDYAYALIDKYGTGASELACQMYDAVAEASNITLPPAEPAPLPEYSEVAKTVNGTLKTRSQDIMSQAVSRLVKRTGVDTTMKNAIRDGAEWAWVPHGDTCAFCITLASRGWLHASEKLLKNGHAEHIHANCDCTYAVRFDGKGNVEGYDPDKYLEMYENAEGEGWKDKVNAMRREHYAENKDEINAQKRETYAKKRAENIRKMFLSTGSDDIIKSEDDMMEIPLDKKNMYNSMDILYDRVQYVPELKDYDDVFIHGNEHGVCYKNADGIETDLPGMEFIKLLRKLNLKKGKIRLCACNTGALDDGFAQFVADITGKEVLAPTKTVWIPSPDKNGVSEMEVAGKDKKGRINRDDPGEWKNFIPHP